MTKIVHVISDTNIGGAGKYLLTYLEYHNRKQFDVTVILPQNSKLEPNIKELGLKVETVPHLAEKSFDIKAVFAIKKILKKIKPELIHCHAALSARVAGKLAGVNCIVYTRHSVFKPDEALTKGVGRALNSWLNRWAASGIIAVAKAARQNLLDTGVDPKKIKVIYNGVKPLNTINQEKKDGLRKTYGLRESAIILAIAARLEPVKGHEYLIDAAGQIRDMGIDAQFIIAGTGSSEAELRQKVKDKGLEDTVIFAGFVRDIEGLMNLLDIQLNASYGTEAASLSLLEGMSIGKPAVVSDFGGNPELIEDNTNGFVVPERNANAMAMAIAQLIRENGKREAMSVQAKKVFESRFTAQKMVNQMEEYYKELLNG